MIPFKNINSKLFKVIWFFLLSATLSHSQTISGNDSIKISVTDTNKIIFDNQNKIKSDTIVFTKQDSLKKTPNKISNTVGHLLINKKNKLVKSQDTLVSRKKKQISSNVDSSARKSLLKKIIPVTTGNIKSGYDYGVLPFASVSNYPSGYFNSQGNIGATVLNIPLTFTYYYSDIKNVSGLNNYYRLAFDFSKYKKYTSYNSMDKIQEQKDQLSNLLQIKQQLIQKEAYAEMLKSNYTNIDSLNSRLNKYKTELNSYENNPSSTNLTDTLTSGLTNSLSPKNNSVKNFLRDSVSQLTNLINKYDSVVTKVEEYSEQVKKVEQQIKAVNNKIQNLEQPDKVLGENQYLKKYQSFLSGIKKFEIGNCYPNYSTFLINGSSLNGINFEYEKKLYLAFTYGKTINTINTTNNLIQNQLQTTRNLYNFFDFNNVKDSRKILAFKTGYGKKDKSHIHIGFLYGSGYPSYIGQITQTSKEINLVVELDGKVALNKNNAIELVFGKSSVFENGTFNSVTDNNYPFSKFRSNALQLKYVSDINKSKTKITTTARIIDPFFKSYGVGFIRSDNIRYEVKIDQVITSKIKLNAFYRADRDNILNLFSNTNRLQTLGLTIAAKINKQIITKASYLPVIQNSINKDSSQYSVQRINNIATAFVSYTPKIRSTTSTFNFLYSYYNLISVSGDANFNKYENYMFSNATNIGKKFRNDVSINYFKRNNIDSVNNNSLFITNSVSYNNKGVNVTLGGKISYNQKFNYQTGAVLKVNIPIIKHISVELMAEKLILGDFYNSYNISDIKKFPYYGNIRLNISW